jgi:hypothetical protein
LEVAKNENTLKWSLIMNETVTFKT